MNGLELRSRISKDGELELSLAEVTVPAPGPGEVVVRVEATPISPSDLALLLGPADPASLAASGTPERPVLTAKVPASRLPFVAARLDQAMAVGNEGAGLSREAEAAAHHLVRVPIRPGVDSLNLAVATGIALSRLTSSSDL